MIVLFLTTDCVTPSPSLVHVHVRPVVVCALVTIALALPPLSTCRTFSSIRERGLGSPISPSYPISELIRRVVTYITAAFIYIREGVI